MVNSSTGGAEPEKDRWKTPKGADRETMDRESIETSRSGAGGYRSSALGETLDVESDTASL
jgi:hypothetical protein